MPGRRIYAAVFALSISLAFGQSDPVRKYNLLREDDDWTFLRDPTLREDIWDPIKYIPWRQGAADWNLSLGAKCASLSKLWETTIGDNSPSTMHSGCSDTLPMQMSATANTFARSFN